MYGIEYSRLDANPGVITQRKKIIHDFETVFPCRHVDARNINQIGELGIVMVFQKTQDGNNTLRSDKHLEFVASRQLNFLHKFRHTLGNVFSKICQIFPLHGVKLPNCGYNKICQYLWCKIFS